MTLFEGSERGSERALSRRTMAGMWAVVVAVVVLVALTFLPTAFVIQRPGPVYDTIGTAESADGEQLPLIEVSGTKTYEDTAGTLDLTTVQVVGNRERTPSWFELALAWLDPSRAVVPIDAVFPQGVTTEEREEENALLMVDSQAEATAAALSELGHDVGAAVEVADIADDAPAAGVLEVGDRILSADGTAVEDATQLRELIQDAGGQPVELAYERDGERGTARVTPEEGRIAGERAWLIGITLTTSFDFPFDVRIQLDNVGGPSAGMMFALGIIDVLTPGALNGGEPVAGTGTIAADGTVGPIGGIRQKLYGARDAGAEWFLAPAANCNEVAGHVPDGLHVFAVETLDDSLDALEGISSGETADLATCDG